MPPPSENQVTQIAEVITAHVCPPEGGRTSVWRGLGDLDTLAPEAIEDTPLPTIPTRTSVLSLSDDDSVRLASGPLRMERQMTADAYDDTACERSRSAADPCACRESPVTPCNSLLRYEFSNVRLLQTHSWSYLRSGSRFVGTQMSDKQVYNVVVEIKHVDISESYLCGYLRIQGLTDDHPNLTTFFEGEIIGTKYAFRTCNEGWGTNEKIDICHWSRFPAWKRLAEQAKRADFAYHNFAQREHVFMRWKEYFLVPDHRVRTIAGASFAGFYYTCFNQVEGSVSGVYFHVKSERFQQLKLKHVEDRGCAPAIEFR